MARTIVGNLVNSKLYSFPNDLLKVLPHMGFGEALCEETTPDTVRLGVSEGEDGVDREVGELGVEVSLGVAAGNSVDLTESLNVEDGDLIRGDSNDWTIFLVKLVDVEDSPASGHSRL